MLPRSTLGSQLCSRGICAAAPLRMELFCTVNWAVGSNVTKDGDETLFDEFGLVLRTTFKIVVNI
ncbi:hypothetical protein CDL12_24371 [Handroanthus impetiginosus]|uniref:Uncharacterized protein n=1 Tax=Handroanthus impetiginosus TaxID=429701 RepID=A0A2G9GCV1_9LAMI|nr:hypothetical protein CDL12_24371 [Handroanthus impetiginosus]